MNKRYPRKLKKELYKIEYIPAKEIDIQKWPCVYGSFRRPIKNTKLTSKAFKIMYSLAATYELNQLCLKATNKSSK